MRKSLHRVRRRKGFTLLEVLMVIVILGVLAAVVISQLSGTQEKAFRDTTTATIKGMASQLELFKLHCGRYPSSDEGLGALLAKPDDESLEGKWAGPYIKEAAKDAWGKELMYRQPGQYNETGYDIWSVGPDGQEGTDDDLTNWTKT